MKKSLYILLAIVALCLVACDSSTEVNGVNYTLGADEATVVKNEAHPYAGNVVIPDTLLYKDKKYAVVAIGDEAFADCIDLAAITIPATVKTFGTKAFANCTGLKTFTCNVESPLEADSTTFDGVEISTIALNVPLQSAQSYSAMPYWNNFHLGASAPTEVPSDDHGE